MTPKALEPPSGKPLTSKSNAIAEGFGVLGSPELFNLQRQLKVPKITQMYAGYNQRLFEQTGIPSS